MVSPGSDKVHSDNCANAAKACWYRFPVLSCPRAPRIVPQIEAWAAKHGVTLAKPGWKVELAKRVKERILEDGPEKIDPAVLDLWTKLFKSFQQPSAAGTATGSQTVVAQS